MMGDGISTGYVLQSGKSSSGGTWLHSVELLPKWVPWKSPISQADAKTKELYSVN